MSTVVLRLSGPLQAWPSHSRGTRRPTYRAPTYSGLSGLLAAAFGRSRTDATDPLAGAEVVVRIDSPGHPQWDFQTINQLPSPDDRFVRTRELRTQMFNMSGGPYHPTVVTSRQYLADASFVCIIESGRGRAIADALASPRWATYFGRKACSPGVDIVLGEFEAPADHLLEQIPVVDREGRNEKVAREVHWLTGAPSGLTSTMEQWVDQPAGPVGASYQTRSRACLWGSFPSVTDGAALRQWAMMHRVGGGGV